MRRLLCALALAALVPTGRAGEVQVESKALFYDVAGTTDQAILDDLRRQARSVGQEYFADARWFVRWTYDYHPVTRSLCGLRNVRLYLTQRTVLPRWSGAGAAAELVGRWKRFVEAVRLHEQGHQEHGVRAANEVRDTLGGMTAADCDSLGREANRTGEAIIARYAGLDARYDAETEHGLRQGAFWKVTTPSRAPVPAR